MEVVLHVENQHHYQHMIKKMKSFANAKLFTNLTISLENVSFEHSVHYLLFSAFCNINLDHGLIIQNEQKKNYQLTLQQDPEVVSSIIELLYTGTTNVHLAKMKHLKELAQQLHLLISTHIENEEFINIVIMSHKDILLNYIWNDRRISANCDLVFITNDFKQNVAHKEVFAVYSKYFENMYKARLDLSRPLVLVLQNVENENLELLLEYCYKGSIKFTQTNIERLNNISKLFGMQLALDVSNIGINYNRTEKNSKNNDNDMICIGRPPAKPRPIIVELINNNKNYGNCYIWQEQKCIMVHAIVMKTFSPFLKKIYEFIDWNVRDVAVIINTFSYMELKAIIDFIYTGETNLVVDQLGIGTELFHWLGLSLSDNPGHNDNRQYYKMKAYNNYIQSLALVTDVLKTDISNPNLSHKDKWNLIEFAKQSVERLVFIVKKGQNSSDSGVLPRNVTSPVPSENLVNEQSYITLCQKECEDEMIMSRYQKRLGMATSSLEKQNLELELARQLVEKAAINRNRQMQATAWAMQTAHKKFKIQEKLQNGKLKECDFKKQQLYALSLQFNQNNSWLNQLANDLALYPNHEKIVRELLDNILTDNSQPVKATINHMQEKINVILDKSLLNPDADQKEHAHIFEEVANTIKDDINIIQDVVKALFEPLNTDKNASITSEVVHHVYFAPLKQNIITLIRFTLKDVEKELGNRIKAGFEEGINFKLTECCKEAITKLHYLTTLHNPYDMLDCIVHIIKLLAATKFEQKHCTSVGADDLLPRLCQLVVSSSLPSICAEAAFMETFMPSARALGEDGYAVTMLQSAIAHLANTPV